MSDNNEVLTTESADAEAVNITPEVQRLFDAGIQFGYRKSRRHPKMRPFIAGVKSNVEVFHLSRVEECLEEAKKELANLGMQGKLVLWVGTKPPAAEFVERTAGALNHPYVIRRWLGGTLSNFDQIRNRVKHLESLEQKREQGELEKYTKQERLRISEEIEKLNMSVGSLRRLERRPDAMVIVDTKEEEIALAEATKGKVKTFALLNSDCDPTLVDYPIPGNDNSPKSVAFVLEELQNAYIDGQKKAPKNDEEKKHVEEKQVTK